MHPVCRDRPLALCDCRSIDPEDLITADRVLPHAVGEVYFLGHNENQKWSDSTQRPNIRSDSTNVMPTGTGSRTRLRASRFS